MMTTHGHVAAEDIQVGSMFLSTSGENFITITDIMTMCITKVYYDGVGKFEANLVCDYVDDLGEEHIEHYVEDLCHSINKCWTLNDGRVDEYEYNEIYILNQYIHEEDIFQFILSHNITPIMDKVALKLGRVFRYEK